jgi:hypothetical protein
MSSRISSQGEWLCPTLNGAVQEPTTAPKAFSHEERMNPDLGTTNTWLAILAVASLGQFLLLVVTGIVVFRTYRRTASAIENFEQRHLVPITGRVTMLIDDLQDVTARARRVDDVVRNKLDGVESVMQRARHIMALRAWPIVGIARAVRAGVASWTDGGTPQPMSEAPARVTSRTTI